MPMPGHERGVIPEAKIRDYLLNPTHSRGRDKSRFFTSLGFVREEWEALDRAIRRDHLDALDGESLGDHPWGHKYKIEGDLEGPEGKIAWVRTLWIYRPDEDFPRFVTAYPRHKP